MTGTQGWGMGDACQSQASFNLCIQGSPSWCPTWSFLPAFRTRSLRPTCCTALLGLTRCLFGDPRFLHQGPQCQALQTASGLGSPRCHHSHHGVVTACCLASRDSWLRSASYTAHSSPVPLRNPKKPLGKFDLIRSRALGNQARKRGANEEDGT